ncbi:MAG: zinc-ribbon domain-containing protein [Candidatus Heimdallarchaeota archaeon]
MSKRNDICPYCGSALEDVSEFCQNCGASLSVVESTTSVRIISESQPSPSYTVVQPQTTTYVPRKQDDSQGTIALIFGILACVGILPCIGGIIAISVGNNAKGSSSGSIAVTLGWISICLQIVATIVLTSIFWWF